MEIRVSANGKRLVSREQKKVIVRELASGSTGPELSRKYGIPIQTIYKWKRDPELMSKLVVEPGAQVVSLDEFKTALAEVKQLRQALGKMTLDRDILKEAVDIATKKEWI